MYDEYSRRTGNNARRWQRAGLSQSQRQIMRPFCRLCLRHALSLALHPPVQYSQTTFNRYFLLCMCIGRQSVFQRAPFLFDFLFLVILTRFRESARVPALVLLGVGVYFYGFCPRRWQRDGAGGWLVGRCLLARVIWPAMRRINRRRRHTYCSPD